MKLTTKIADSGQSGTMWLSLITVLLSAASTPELGKILPPQALPYMVLLMAVLTSIKRIVDTKAVTSTVYFMAVNAALAILAMPEWIQVLPVELLPYFSALVSGVTWYKRIVFPSHLEPETVGPNTPADLHTGEIDMSPFGGPQV